MPLQELTTFLDANRINYTTIEHAPTFTAQELAESTHVRGKEVAKTVMVNVDGHTAMAVVPSSSKVDLERLRDVTGAKEAHLLTEPEFASRFSGCELGAMPPFGNLYGMEVYVDDALAADPEIVFNAGTHTEAMRVAYDDFARVVKPKLARLRLAD